MCSDTHPDNIPDLEKRIKTRFLMGGIVDILPYDLETRMAILQKKINDESKKTFQNHFNIPDDVIYISLAEPSKTTSEHSRGHSTGSWDTRNSSIPTCNQRLSPCRLPRKH